MDRSAETHPAADPRGGQRMFVDFAGQVFDGATGEARRVEIFVAVLGAASYTYAEATRSQGLPDWSGAHVNALAFFGGAPRQIVCDNLRSGITRACFYEPMVNRPMPIWRRTMTPR
jgi:transposase